jgi:hypothetical protein
MRIDWAKRLKELEQANARLKKLVADLSLDKAILKEVNRGKLLRRAKRCRAVGRVWPGLELRHGDGEDVGRTALKAYAILGSELCHIRE